MVEALMMMVSTVGDCGDDGGDVAVVGGYDEGCDCVVAGVDGMEVDDQQILMEHHRYHHHQHHHWKQQTQRTWKAILVVKKRHRRTKRKIARKQKRVLVKHDKDAIGI